MFFGIFVGALSLISLTGSIIAFFKFYFYIKDGELNVRKGVIRKTSLNVPFERIQSINFEQNLIHQIFNVVSVKIDTAGSSGNELEIDAISKEHAYALRDYILKEKEALRGSIEVVDEEFDRQEKKRLILALSPIDLLKVGVSQNHLRTAALILAFFLSIADDLGEALDYNFFNQIEEGVGQALDAGFFIALIFIPVFIFISFLITLIRTVFQHFDLKFWKTENGFKLVSGLLTRKEKNMQNEKVQIISWGNNPIKRIFGIFRLRLYQAASVDVVGNKSMIIPGVYQHQVDETIRAVMPKSENVEMERHGIHHLSRFRFVWFFGLLPLTIATIIGYLTSNSIWYWTWLYLPLALYMAQMYYVKRGFRLHPDYFISEGGIFGRSNKMIELFKVQAVKLSQGWYETRTDLSTIHIYTAAGEISVPYLPIELAQRLRDYVTYRVESDQSNWM